MIIIGVNVQSEAGSYWKFSGDIPVVIGSMYVSNASLILESGDIQIGAVEIKDADSGERTGVTGSRLNVNTLGSTYILGTGSVQVTNVPTVSGAGIFSVLGSQAITNIPSVSGAGTFITSGNANVLGSVAITNVPIILGSVAVTNVPTVSGTGIFTTQGSIYLLGTGSVQITNTPSVSGVGVFSVAGSQAITNVPTVSGGGMFIVLGSVHNTAPLTGSNYLLGTGSVQITNVPTVSGGGIYTVLGSINITNQTILVSGAGQFNVIGSTYNTAPLVGSNYLLGIGSFREVETVPNDVARTNARTDFTYDSSNRIASIFEIIGTASYFQVFTWSGNGNVLTIGSVRTI